jgi:spore coat polysaccharide biosynthesis predicted glycosyltransferase SpsG
MPARNYLSQKKISFLLIKPNLSFSEEVKRCLYLVEREKSSVFLFLVHNKKIALYRKLKEKGIRTICVDYFGYAIKDFDVVINWNTKARKLYKREKFKKSKLFLGINSTPVSILCMNYRNQFRVKKTVKTILVAMGGSDPFNMTLKVLLGLQGVKNIDELNINVLLGHAYKHFDKLRKHLLKLRGNIEIKRGIVNPYLAMKDSDIAIASGGLTSLEILHIGVPAILITSFHHEAQRCNYLNSKGIAEYLGDYKEVSLEDIASKTEEMMHYSRRIKFNKAAMAATDFNIKEKMYSAIYKLIFN